MSQMALPLQLADHAVFASFHATGNEILVGTLERLATGGASEGCWLWGASSTGKTHLLQAVCDRAGDESVFLPLAMLADVGPAILDGQATRSIVCIDDVDAIAGDRAWELALFNLCNELHEGGKQLVVSAGAAPREVGFDLADLASRVSRLPVFQVHELDETERVAALQLRAEHRGIELPDETASYLLRRVPRDMASLYALLDRLDIEALRAKRRLTIPFVRDVLNVGRG